MRKSSRKIWTFFVGTSLVVAFGLARLTVTQLELERQKAAADQMVTYNANLRQALWRMDSIVAPSLAREAARPYFEYTPFYAPERVYDRRWTEVKAGETLLPSPLLDAPLPWVKLHFQIAPDGTWTSPQVPSPRLRELVPKLGLAAEKVRAHEQLLAGLSRSIDIKLLRRTVPERDQDPRRQSVRAAASRSEPAPAMTEAQQAQINAHEYERRGDILSPESQAAKRSFNPQPGSLDAYINLETVEPPTAAPTDPTSGAIQVYQTRFVPYWVYPAKEDVQLFYLRGVLIGDAAYVQGFWVDWKMLRASLLHAVEDLFAEAQLLPAPPDGVDDPSQLLTAIPSWLAAPVPGPQPLPYWTPTRISVSFAWIAFLAGIGAVGLGLHSLTELSERRLDFVSAVTHELRTPLTTFRMYSEMLAEGMVQDPEQQREYSRTLEREADRLSHLVQNVLDYSRLERKAWKPRRETTSVAELLRRLADRADERCRDSDVALVVENQTAEQTAVRTDPTAVEQIIYNLVDNACKYGSSGDDKRVHLRATAQNGLLALDVIDHGDGIAPEDAARIFGAFSRGTRDEHRHKPGVGLGLALSRRWSRALGGQLELRPRVPDVGACFRLTLPGARAS